MSQVLRVTVLALVLVALLVISLWPVQGWPPQARVATPSTGASKSGPPAYSDIRLPASWLLRVASSGSVELSDLRVVFVGSDSGLHVATRLSSGSYQIVCAQNEDGLLFVSGKGAKHADHVALARAGSITDVVLEQMGQVDVRIDRRGIGAVAGMPIRWFRGGESGFRPDPLVQSIARRLSAEAGLSDLAVSDLARKATAELLGRKEVVRRGENLLTSYCTSVFSDGSGSCAFEVPVGVSVNWEMESSIDVATSDVEWRRVSPGRVQSNAVTYSLVSGALHATLMAGATVVGVAAPFDAGMQGTAVARLGVDRDGVNYSVIEKEARIGSDGKFAIECLSSGMKTISVRWCDKGMERWMFWSGECVLADSTVADLGLVQPRGRTVTASSVLRMDGARRECAGEMDLTIASGGADWDVSETWRVPLGRQVVISGMPPGYIMLTASIVAASVTPSIEPAVVRSVSGSADGYGDKVVELVFEANATVACSVGIDASPQLPESARLQGAFQIENGSPWTKCEFERERDRFVLRARLPRGCAAFNVVVSANCGDCGLCVDGPVFLDGEGHGQVKLRLAAAVRFHLADDAVKVQLVSIMQRNAKALGVVVVQEGGEFVCKGLIPDTEYFAENPSFSFRTPAAGKTSDLGGIR